MFATARPASDGPARSCTLAYTSTNLRSVSTVQKKSIRGKLKEYRGRSAFTFVPFAAVRSTGTSTSGPTTMALPLGAFADPDFPAPTLSVWEQSRHSWINLPEGMQHFPKARV